MSDDEYRGNPNNPSSDRPKSNLRPRSASQQSTTDEILEAISDNESLAVYFDDYSLPPRQAEVGYLMLMELSDKQIAAKLGIIEKTVRDHAGKLIKRLGLANGCELVEKLKTISYGEDS